MIEIYIVLIVLLVILWLAPSFYISRLANRRGRSRRGWLIFSLIFSPLIAIVFLPDSKEEKEKKSSNTKTPNNKIKFYYCMYCGKIESHPKILIREKCNKHPNGSKMGNHEVYEGAEESRYTCKYCGRIFGSIEGLTSGKCQKHPRGHLKGYHAAGTYYS